MEPITAEKEQQGAVEYINDVQNAVDLNKPMRFWKQNRRITLLTTFFFFFFQEDVGIDFLDPTFLGYVTYPPVSAVHYLTGVEVTEF